MYKHPGVYIEELPSGLIPIAAASTSVAAFIGPVKRGRVGEPTFITGITQFEKLFGRMNDPAGGIRDLKKEVDSFGHAVHAFFGNGGTMAYIVRVAKDDAASATANVTNPAGPLDKIFAFSASSAGVWGNDVVVKLSAIVPSDPELGYRLDIGSHNKDGDFIGVETFSPLDLDPDSSRSLVNTINDNSELVRVEREDLPAPTDADKTVAILGGDLSGFNPADLVDKELKLKLDSDVALKVTITFGSDETKFDTIAEVANIIQDTVRDHAGNPAKKALAHFQCLVTLDNKLMMLSGTRGPASNLEIQASGALAVLQLEAGNQTTQDFAPFDHASLSGGSDGAEPTAKTDFTNAFTTLRDYRDVSIMLLPGQTYEDTGKEIFDAAIAHAAFMKNRVVVVDLPENVKLISPKDVKDVKLTNSSYAALYYPWLEVSNPYHHPETGANKPRTFKIAPSASAAGIWSRTDGRRGVWKAPAGLEAQVRGSLGPTRMISNEIQDNLNDLGINCIRNVIGPPVLWGARMLSTNSQPDFRYVSVRRTSILIGESLYKALQTVVFEPNKHTLWASLKANVGNFMEDLFRAGAFQGRTSKEAYYVRCGLDDTMTQSDIDNGIVRVIVGYAALKPAEFVVIQIKQTVGQSAQ